MPPMPPVPPEFHSGRSTYVCMYVHSIIASEECSFCMYVVLFWQKVIIISASLLHLLPESLLIIIYRFPFSLIPVELILYFYTIPYFEVPRLFSIPLNIWSWYNQCAVLYIQYIPKYLDPRPSPTYHYSLTLIVNFYDFAIPDLSHSPGARSQPGTLSALYLTKVLLSASYLNYSCTNNTFSLS